MEKFLPSKILNSAPWVFYNCFEPAGTFFPRGDITWIGLPTTAARGNTALAGGYLKPRHSCVHAIHFAAVPHGRGRKTHKQLRPQIPPEVVQAIKDYWQCRRDNHGDERRILMHMPLDEIRARRGHILYPALVKTPSIQYAVCTCALPLPFHSSLAASRHFFQSHEQQRGPRASRLARERRPIGLDVPMTRAGGAADVMTSVRAQYTLDAGVTGARDTTRNAHLPVHLDLPAHDEEVRPRCVPGVWLNSMNKILIYTYVEGEGEEGSEVESV
ncbi:hypothetical protein B0H13DRAFT_1919649 [Mycena leptocephala]|nr:hypothetical protein B0H13DRAFT_1919649 [Mycena leptocephala]